MEECKLLRLARIFDDLREEEDMEYTEEDILAVLQEENIEQYEFIEDVPTRMVNQVLTAITKGECRRLDPNQEQDILDYFEQLQMKLNIATLAKGLRYLLRKDLSSKSALLVVDVQNDFISGSLALKNAQAGQDGEEVIDVINDILANQTFDMVAYSFDWHPEDHCSYVSNVTKYPLHSASKCSAQNADIYSKVIYDGDKPLEQILWPDHCIQHSFGAELHENLNFIEDGIKVYKGQNCCVDSYSAFWDNGKLSQTNLLLELLDKNITNLYVCGLAFDFCVGFTSLDGSEHGFKTCIIEDACRGVADESIDAMKEKLKSAGVESIQTDKLPELLSS